MTIKNKEGKSYELRVFNQQGQMVYSGRYHNSNEQIRTTSWANGVYLLQVVVDDAVYVQRVVKE